MSRLRTALLPAALSAALLTGGLPAALAATKARTAAPVRGGVDIAYSQFTLPNGLRVVVHEDHKAPIVAVNIWYHVGSKDEPTGRSGFAHLFEHLMFNGSENHRGEFFGPFEQAGATGQNGTTNTDRTNYFENVPTTAVDMALWMESDRMGHLTGAIDQKTLDEQRGVVQNEKRQGENQPYGQLWTVMSHTMYPVGHPYHHTVIGSMNDLNAASLEDVKIWFRTWYGPNNAVLVLAGDITPARARELATKYFGDIPATPSMQQPRVNPAPLTASGRTVLKDKVPQVRLVRAWNVAPAATTDSDMLDLFAQLLGGSSNSRLDRRLVYQDKLVDAVSVSNDSSQLGGTFSITAMVKQGVEVAKVEAAIDEELQRLLREGPTPEELARARITFQAGFTRGVERIGGFGGKADVLASCTIYTGNPGCFRKSLDTIARATPMQIRTVANNWLGKPSHVFVVEPGARTAMPEDPAGTPAPFTPPKVDAKYRTTASTVDRTKGVPAVQQFPTLTFPRLQRATLDNGTTVVLAERHEVPVVQMNYLFNGGYASDMAKPGQAAFTMGMLDEGTTRLDSLAFKARAESLGAQIGAAASLDGSTAMLSALKANLAPSVQLFAEMLRSPAFNQADIDRVKAQWLAGIRQEKASPTRVAQRLIPGLLFGEGNPYAAPRSGTGTEASVGALTAADLRAYHNAWVRPEGATLVVVGDTTLNEVVPLLNKTLGDWKPAGSAPAAVKLTDVARPKATRIYLVDQPGAPSAVIAPAQVLPSTRDARSELFNLSNDVLGGQFSSRLNMNLREDKHWSYGVYSGAGNALGQRIWMAPTQVQTDKAAESLAEMRREIADYASGKRPATQAEIDKTINNDLRGQPGQYETAAAVAGEIAGMVRYGRPDNWIEERNRVVSGFNIAQATEMARRMDPDQLTWVVVGDLSKIEAPIRALNLGEVVVVDSDGKPLKR